MFTNYDIDFGKLNLNWLHSVSIELDEITDLVEVSERAQTYLQANGQIEVTGYTNRRKFISVIFTITGQQLVVDDVNFPSYETIQDVILRRLAQETEWPLDEWENPRRMGSRPHQWAADEAGVVCLFEENR